MSQEKEKKKESVKEAGEEFEARSVIVIWDYVHGFVLLNFSP